MAGTQPTPPMILGNCISCNGLMRVPVTTDVSHVARCPHCDARFPVQQLIASAIPAAEIMVGEVADDLPAVDRVRDSEDGPKDRSKFEVPKQLYDGAKHRKRRRRRRSRGSDERKENVVSSGGGGGNGQAPSRRKIDPSQVPLASTQSAERVEAVEPTLSVESPAATEQAKAVESKAGFPSSTAASASTSRSSSRSYTPDHSKERSNERSRSSSSGSSSGSRSSSRRSSSQSESSDDESSILEWGKILSGGMIAFPLAYLGMMWITGLDPFSLAPKIESVIPALVPTSLSEQTEASPDNDPIEDLDFDNGFEDGPLPMPTLDPDEVRG